MGGFEESLNGRNCSALANTQNTFFARCPVLWDVTEGCQDVVERLPVSVHEAPHVLQDERLGEQIADDLDDLEAQGTFQMEGQTDAETCDDNILLNFVDGFAGSLIVCAFPFATNCLLNKTKFSS